MMKFKNRVLTLILAGLMAGQAILPVSAVEITNATQGTENTEPGIMLINEAGIDATTTEAETPIVEETRIVEPDAENEGETESIVTDVVTAESAPEDSIKENEGLQVTSLEEDVDETKSNNTGEGVSIQSDSKAPILFTGGKTGTHDTIKTVDSTALGVKMYMYNFPVPDTYYTEDFQTTMGDSTRIFQDDGDDEDPANDLGILQSLLGDDGYPVLASTGQSLKTWFDTDTDAYDATQANHLFSQAEYDQAGYLAFDCMQNYAYFDQSTGNFKVYEDVGVPYWGAAVEEDGTLKTNEDGNQIVYSHMEHGQFFPYDDLTDFAEPNFRQTYNIYGEALSEDDPQYGRTLYRSTGYTFHFGMQISTNFIQPIDGMVTAGDTAQNMRYEFTGDDDLWVFIDDVLVLDIGGIHPARSGYIDFATGEVYQAAVDQRTTIKALFENAGVADRVEWNGDTFADYTEHTFKMFYMERGENCGGLQVRMNLVTIPENHAAKQVFDASGNEIDGQAVEIGDELTYKITAENPASVTKDITVTDVLPDGVEFISADEGGICNDGKVAWTLTMDAGSQRTVTCKVRIKDEAAGTTIRNNAIEEIGKIAITTNEVTNPVNSRYQIKTEVVNGTITEPVSNIRKGSDQQISYSADEGYILDSVTVDGKSVDAEQFADTCTFENIEADHSIKVTYVKLVAPIKAVTQGDANVVGQYITDGEEVTYAIMVSNPSGVKQDITVTDTVSDSLTIKKVSDDGKIDGQKITWTLKDVPAHSSQTVSFTAAAVGADKEQTVDNAAQMTIGGHTLTSNNVRILIPVKPKVTTKETTVTNKTVINETENNVVEKNKTINNETKNNTKTNETQVNQTQTTETTAAANTTNTASAANSRTTTSNDVASANTATNVNSVTPVNNATISGYRNVNTGDASRTLILIAIAAAATVGLGIYYYRKRR